MVWQPASFTAQDGDASLTQATTDLTRATEALPSPWLGQHAPAPDGRGIFLGVALGALGLIVTALLASGGWRARLLAWGRAGRSWTTTVARDLGGYDEGA